MWIKGHFSLDLTGQSMVFFNCILMIEFFLLISFKVTSGVAQSVLFRARSHAQEIVSCLYGFGLFVFFMSISKSKHRDRIGGGMGDEYAMKTRVLCFNRAVVCWHAKFFGMHNTEIHRCSFI